MNATTESGYKLPAWLESDLWAQACDRDGDVEIIGRDLVDMAGKVVFEIPEGVVVFLAGARVYNAPEGGEEIGMVRFPQPRRAAGPLRVHCTLDEYSH